MDSRPDNPVVLVADNDAGVSGVLTEVLKRHGLTVEACPDGRAAWDRLRRGGVGLLVCDLDMPRMSGEELIDALEAAGDASPVVVISGYLDAELKAALAGRRNVRRVLKKPFDVLAFGRLAFELVNAGRRNGRALERS